MADYSDLFPKYDSAYDCIYAAIDLLQRAQVESHPWLVESIASVLWDGNLVQRAIRRLKVSSALQKLIREDKVFLASQGVLQVPKQSREVTEINWNMFALPVANQVLKLADQHPTEILNCLENLGLLYYDVGYLMAACFLWHKGTQLAPKDPKFWFLNGLGALGMGFASSSETLFRRALELDPNFARAHHGLANLLVDLRRYEEAEREYRGAIACDPPDVSCHFELARLLYLYLARKDEAEIEYRRALAYKPDDALAHHQLATLMVGSGRTAEAIVELRRALDCDPDLEEAHYLLGVLLSDQGKYPAAAECLQRAVQICPDHAFAYNKLGLVWHHLNRWAEAE